MSTSVVMDQFLLDLENAVELPAIESPGYVAIGDHIVVICK